jgi:hypothetical protein
MSDVLKSQHIGHDMRSAGFIWDMLDLNSVDWDALAEHHADMMEGA